MEQDILQQGNIDTGISAQPSPEMAMGEMGGGDMTPDEAAAALAFITKLSEGHMEQQGMAQGEQPMQGEQMVAPMEEEVDEPMGEGEVIEEEPFKEEETEEDEGEENDTDSRIEEITSSIDKMQQEHEKAIESLRSEIKDENMKKDYEKKIAKLEEKHSKQLEALKEEIKNILDEDSD